MAQASANSLSPSTSNSGQLTNSGASTSTFDDASSRAPQSVPYGDATWNTLPLEMRDLIRDQLPLQELINLGCTSIKNHNEGKKYALGVKIYNSAQRIESSKKRTLSKFIRTFYDPSIHLPVKSSIINEICTDPRFNKIIRSAIKRDKEVTLKTLSSASLEAIGKLFDTEKSREIIIDRKREEYLDRTIEFHAFKCITMLVKDGTPIKEKHQINFMKNIVYGSWAAALRPGYNSDRYHRDVVETAKFLRENGPENPRALPACLAFIPLNTGHPVYTGRGTSVFYGIRTITVDGNKTVDGIKITKDIATDHIKNGIVDTSAGIRLPDSTQPAITLEELLKYNSCNFSHNDKSIFEKFTSFVNIWPKPPYQKLLNKLTPIIIEADKERRIKEEIKRLEEQDRNTDSLNEETSGASGQQSGSKR